MSKGIREQEPSIDQPLVSVCIPTYNAARTVKQTLESILNQTYRNIEILVVDNASEDETIALVQQFNDPRLTIYRNDRDIGGEQNWSHCIELARGRYIGIFHADDLYMPNMVQEQVQAFQNNPAIGAVFTMTRHINSRNEVIGETNLPGELRGKGIYYFPEVFLSVLGNLNFLVCPSAMVRGKLYKKLAPFNVERFGTSADLDMWLRILQACPIAILDECLMQHRISDTQGSFTTRYLRTEPADFFKVMNHYLDAESGALHIPHNALRKYEFLRAIDNTRCAVNHLIKGQSQEAKALLQSILSTDTFLGAMECIRKPKFLVYWVFGVVLLGLVCLGLGRYLGRILHWFLYRWGRRKFV